MNGYLKLSHAYVEVRLIEPIGDIPAQRPKLFPLLNKCMEEAKPKEEFLPNLVTKYQNQ